mgnify:CR=1 FL=1
MDSQNDRINILIVGATGHLGSLITKHCLAQPKLLVNILVRDPQKNKELTESVEKAGGKVWKGDLCQPETLDEPTKGMHTVLSTTFQMDKQSGLDGQIALIDACVRNGVKRFSPSDYGESVEKLSKEELRELGLVQFKVDVLEYLKTQPIKSIHFWPGVFMEMFFKVNAKGLSYWGNVDHVYNITSYEDTAKFVAAALVDENRTGDHYFSVNTLTINQIAEIYNQIRGTNVTPKCHGSFEALKAAFGFSKKNDPISLQTNMLAIFQIIYDDRCSFDKTHQREFPDVQTTSLKEFLEQNPHVKLPAESTGN